MSTFSTFPSENKTFDFYIRNSRILTFLKILLVASFIGLFAVIDTVFIFVLIFLFAAYVYFYERYMRSVKTNGSLEITQSCLKWTTGNNFIEIDKADIVKIFIEKEFFFSIVNQAFKFVSFDIICKDSSVNHIVVKKYSDNKQAFDIIESLRLFSAYNGITLEEKRKKFRS